MAPWRPRLDRTRNADTSTQSAAISELSEALAGERASGLQLFEKLTGSGQLWWRFCRATAQSHSAPLCGDHSRGLRVINDTELRLSRGAISRAAEAASLICQALASPAGPREPLGEAITRATQCWSGSVAVLPPEGPAFTPETALASTAPWLRDRSREILACLDSVTADPRQAMVAICTLLLAASRPDADRSVSVPVVFARPGQRSAGTRGVAGTLELCEFPPGPVGLFPDPRGMRNRRADPAFIDSLSLAWQFAVRPGGTGRCVLWRLSLDGGMPDYAIDGGSLGAAFAVALRELLRRPRGSRPGLLGAPRAFFIGLRPGRAITGVLTAQQPDTYGNPASRAASGPWLAQVGDMDAKLQAAGARRLRLIAPAANRAAAEPRATVPVDWAETIYQADRYARRVQPLRAISATAAILVMAGASAFAGTAVHYHSVAERSAATAARQRAIALSRQLAGESLNLDTVQPNLAKQLAVAGNNIAVTPDATSAAFAALSSPGVIDAPAQVGGIAFSPNGKLLAIGAGDDVRLWDRAHHAFVATLAGHTNPVTGVAFAPDGDILASVAEDQTIRIWDIAAPGHPTLLAILHGEYSSIAFSPDDRTLVAGDYDGTVRQWNVANPRAPAAQPPLTGHTGSVLAVAVSPNGQLIAGASQDGTILLWPSRGGPSVATLTGTGDAPGVTEPISGIAFAPDSGLVAGVDNLNLIDLWPATKSGRIAPEATVTDTASGLSTVAFSPHGNVLAADGDNNVHLWDVTRPQHAVALATLAMDDANGGATGSLSSIRTTAFSHDGTMLAGGMGSNAVELWNVPDIQRPGAIAALGNPPALVTAIAYQAAHHILAVGIAGPNDLAGFVILWDVTDPARPRKAAVITGPSITSLAFSPDGSILAFGGLGSDLDLWDVGTPTRPRHESTIDVGEVSEVTFTAFSADGRMLATNWSEEAVRLWNITNPSRPVGGHVFNGASLMDFSPFGDILVVPEPSSFQVWRVDNATHLIKLAEVSTPKSSYELAFSPNGHLVAIGDSNGAVGLWDLTEPERPRELSVISGNAGNATMRFSPDGSALAVSDPQADPTDVELWDVSDPSVPQQFAAISSGGEPAASFASDGIIAVSDDGSRVDLWPTRRSMIMNLTCTDSGDLITKAQWQQYLPDLPYDPPCR